MRRIVVVALMVVAGCSDTSSSPVDTPEDTVPVCALDKVPFPSLDGMPEPSLVTYDWESQHVQLTWKFCDDADPSCITQYRWWVTYELVCEPSPFWQQWTDIEGGSADPCEVNVDCTGSHPCTPEMCPD